MILFSVSCGSQSSTDNSNESSANDISIMMSIDFPGDSEKADIENVSVSAEEGSSVLDILIKYADENNIKVITDDTNGNPYVTSIDGISETDNSGWTYELNDEMVMEAADQCIVNDGDEIDWSFESWSED